MGDDSRVIAARLVRRLVGDGDAARNLRIVGLTRGDMSRPDGLERPLLRTLGDRTDRVLRERRGLSTERALRRGERLLPVVCEARRGECFTMRREDDCGDLRGLDLPRAVGVPVDDARRFVGLGDRDTERRAGDSRLPFRGDGDLLLLDPRARERALPSQSLLSSVSRSL